jgi:hypothetical protein
MVVFGAFCDTVLFKSVGLVENVYFFPHILKSFRRVGECGE